MIYNHPIGSIYVVYTANWVIIYHRSHLLREPETAVDCHVGFFFGLSPFHSRQNLRPVTLDAVTWQQQVLSTPKISGFLKRHLDSITHFFCLFFVIINSIKDSDVFLYCFVMA